jgi:hypothetical protein
MSDPLSEDRLAEIRESLRVYQQEHVDTGFACCRAHAAADAVPELLAEIARLTPKPLVGVRPTSGFGVTHVRVTETARSGWQVRYRLNGKRRSQRHFPSKDRADAWIEQQRAKHGGTT